MGDRGRRRERRRVTEFAAGRPRADALRELIAAGLDALAPPDREEATMPIRVVQRHVMLYGRGWPPITSVMSAALSSICWTLLRL
ncbi:hypothetical protein [Streptomyces sp. H34-S4]|uniref:hypothetical protein n=1 Tax=Streptomyces sp. H34-S4 TaxID=2996463 RepID=UPI0022703112|nr:hypothetical protein [Streptomyces sp. H34-S4]MCY0936117.1 hypothetical protein [Streptomyces sp. H34-S4]